MSREIKTYIDRAKALGQAGLETLGSKIKGCLLGGAAGDALGYAVEFLKIDDIRYRYGEKGIEHYELRDGWAVFSDDTQMTLFTLEGLLLGYERCCDKGIMGAAEQYIYEAYRCWLKTQGYKSKSVWETQSELLGQPRMHKLRAPGNTCLSALMSKKMGTLEKPINDSKGCGGVMRVAPIGFLPVWGQSSLMLGAKAAAITHGHPLGYIPAAMLADMIEKILYGEFADLRSLVAASLQETGAAFSSIPKTAYFLRLMERAMELSTQPGDDVEIIHSLGGGWVGEEALAIAVYCCLKYEKDFAACLRAAVNHSGDADSTGAIAGNILGAYLGVEGIPQEFLEKLELTDMICRMGEKTLDIFRGMF